VFENAIYFMPCCAIKMFALAGKATWRARFSAREKRKRSRN